ncbi:hypothetical protein [uncultured Eudoraea sp.]|uniref:hypothetical protein n=1 Tax=uncultured Eudoraea sp. TaxID=1035614 RepID=UPI00262F42FC|nr:hypothetical protein [uncultured Eudoraea sp.]
MLKTIVFFYLAFMVFTGNAQQQANQKLVLSINEYVEMLENKSDWDSIVEFQLLNYTSSGAHLSSFFEKDEIQKLSLKASGENTTLEKCFYLKDDELIYFSEKSYDLPYNEGSEDKVPTRMLDYETKCYFDEKRLFQQLELDELNSNNTEIYLKEMGNSILEDLELLKAAIIEKY